MNRIHMHGGRVDTYYDEQGIFFIFYQVIRLVQQEFGLEMEIILD